MDKAYRKKIATRLRCQKLRAVRRSHQQKSMPRSEIITSSLPGQYAYSLDHPAITKHEDILDSEFEDENLAAEMSSAWGINCDSADSEDSITEAENDFQVEEALRQWAVESRIPHSQLEKLLTILRRRLLPGLPKSVKRFLMVEGAAQGTESEIPTLSNMPSQNIFSCNTGPLVEELTAAVTTSVINAVLPLQLQIRQLTKEICRIKVLAAKPQNEEIPDSIENIWLSAGINLPLQSNEDFAKFEEILSNDGNFREIKKYIWQKLDTTEPVFLAVRSIIKHFISRSVIIQYTVIKPVGKKVFVQTRFYACLESVIVEKYNTKNVMVSSKEIHQALSKVFNSAKDWEGMRAERKKSEKLNLHENSMM